MLAVELSNQLEIPVKCNTCNTFQTSHFSLSNKFQRASLLGFSCSCIAFSLR